MRGSWSRTSGARAVHSSAVTEGGWLTRTSTVPAKAATGAAGARAHVDDDGPRRVAHQPERGLHEHLRLGTRDEHVGRDAELVAPEGLDAGEVLKGTAAGALRDQGQEPFPRRGLERIASTR